MYMFATSIHVTVSLSELMEWIQDSHITMVIW